MEVCKWYRNSRNDGEECWYAMPDSIYSCKFSGNCESCTMKDVDKKCAEPINNGGMINE